jgi:hypothetical protein
VAGSKSCEQPHREGHIARSGLQGNSDDRGQEGESTWAQGGSEYQSHEESGNEAIALEAKRTKGAGG